MRSRKEIIEQRLKRHFCTCGICVAEEMRQDKWREKLLSKTEIGPTPKKYTSPLKKEHQELSGMCFKCKEEHYPIKENKRSMGAITVSMGDCPVCGTISVPICPTRDIEYAIASRVNSEMWD